MLQDLPARLLSLANATLVRYLAASVAALAVDIGSFLALLALSTPAGPAAGIGYGLGVIAHWLISSRAVFADEVADRGLERTKQKAGFLVSALLGLALTTAIVSGGTALGLDPRLAKLIAVGASFTLTWLLRSKLVFSARQPA